MRASLEDLRRIVEQASRQRPHLTTRLEKAAFILLLRPIILIANGCYKVGSEDALRWYKVCDGRCECADYQRHGSGHLCKHLLAILIGQELGIVPRCPSPSGDGQTAEGMPPR